MKTVEYKNTLNLPKTAFPMKANLPKKEVEILTHWQEIDLYAVILEATRQRPVFTVLDGPPYANGQIHVGHALNKVLKDIIVKFKLLSGYQVPLRPGWDCHGLPIELNVEKKYGKPGHKISAEEFRLKCREYAQAQVEKQKADFMRLGVLADWKKPYLTMDPTYQAQVVRSLARIYQQGHIQQGQKPVYWCLDCQSSLAEAEVEYHDKVSTALYVAFPVLKPQLLSQVFNVPQTDVKVLIWTTTPWTLPANQAVCLHQDITYAWVTTDQGAYILAEDLVADTMKAAGLERYQILGTALGSCLEHYQVQHPFYNRAVPLILGAHVTTAMGTGCVHTAPAHGVDDYHVGCDYALPRDNPVTANGCYVSDLPELGGHHVTKVDDAILALLTARKNLFHADHLKHSYPHCWRHKSPIIFRATPQWFISMTANKLCEKSLELISQVTWTPSWGEERLRKMLLSRPDWCISRQRTWGVPIPIFIHKETNEPHPETVSLMYQVADLIAQKGLEAWYEYAASPEFSDYYPCTDILDVWFDSGVAHSSVFPDADGGHTQADLYLEGSDQHRGWFQSSLLTSAAMYEQAPYKAVITHGFTVDAAGKKMSKSLGNIISPQEIVSTLGADVWRLWVAANDYSGDLHVSKEILSRVADAYRRIRNTARFLLANLVDFEYPTDKVDAEQMLSLDRWVVEYAQHLQEDIIAAYDSYQFHTVYQKIHNFCITELGSFYLDVIKDRQYTCARTSIARRSAQTAIYHLIQALVRWIAPILTFTAEEIWTHIPHQTAVPLYTTAWYQEFPKFPATNLSTTDWQQILHYRDVINKSLETARAEGLIGSNLAAEVVLYADPKIFTVLSRLEQELRFVLITSAALLKPLTEKSATAMPASIPGLWLEVRTSPYEKCQRCWHRVADVNQNPLYPGLCGRCIQNIAGSGEQRQYA